MEKNSPAELLLVDPVASLSDACARSLRNAGFSVSRCATAAAAFERAAQCAPSVVMVESQLPDRELGSFIAAFKRRYPAALILAMVDGSQSLEASAAIRGGAIDYLQKPFGPEQLLSAINHATRLCRPIPNMVVASHAGRQVLQLAGRAAQTSATVLITGESGTGKERLARFIHDNSPRADQPYVAINCAAIPENMLEATLFGHARGAFTGATQSQPGKFELANGGTLLLDEISEMPLNLQAKLLRVLQEREVERLGSHQKISLDVRVIAATNRDLRALVARGEFREDLFYRLDVLPLMWPSLRERREDILPLAEFFIEKYATADGYSLGAQARTALQNYDWPGNVRELENVMQRALIMARGLQLQPLDLMLPVIPAAQEAAVPQTVACIAEELASSKLRVEFDFVLNTLRRFDGHRTRTAEALGVTTRALRYKLAAMRESGIDVSALVRN